jgi:hypothetical protein
MKQIRNHSGSAGRQFNGPAVENRRRRTSRLIVGMFVEDFDGLLGRVVQENGTKEVTVVREGDLGTLELFGYARRDLTTVDTVAELLALEHEVGSTYIASLFAYQLQ